VVGADRDPLELGECHLQKQSACLKATNSSAKAASQAKR